MTKTIETIETVGNTEAVKLLQEFKEVASKIVKLKECTKTDAQMIRKAYNNINLRINQESAF